MKNAFLIMGLFFALGITNAQTTFSNITDVIKFMENKTYYNSDMDIELEFDIISAYNTYGIKLKSSESSMYFINCDVEVYGSFADVSGISPSDGGSFEFRLYNTKVVVGAGEQRQASFYIKEDY